MKYFSLVFKCLMLTVLLLNGSNTTAQQRYLPRHPRLLFTTEEEPAVRQLCEGHKDARQLADYLKKKADDYCTAPQIDYGLDKYGALLWTSRAYVMRLGTVALAYRLYGEQKYLDAANETLLWVCRYPDWHPAHYLDTAEMCSAVAVAYDWLYGVLPASTKELVKQCLYERGIKLVLREYEKGSPGSWAKRDTNWNVVCNTGMVLAALAVAEEYPEECATILDNAARYMPNCLKHFAPDGVCYEGPAYWGYTCRYLACYLKAVADNDGGRGGIAQLPGLAKTALYSKRTLTPSGRVFNFANAGSDTPNCAAYFFFSKYYNLPEIAQWYRGEIKKIIREDDVLNQFFFLALPWYDAALADRTATLPKMEVYHNTINDILVFNGDNHRKGSLFLIAKGGEPNKAHQQQDCGTFLVESEGVCWTEDLGADDYALPGFWDGKPGGKRWQYFRNNNFSHNTLSIDHQIMYSAGEAFVCEENAEAAQPYAKLDMTTLFKDQATRVTRKFTLLDHRTMEVEDELALVNPESVVSWMAITKAHAEARGNKLHLQQGGKHFYMEIVAPAGAVFETTPAHNSYEGEKPIKGVTRIEAQCRLSDGKGKIIVRMSSKPLVKGEPAKFALNHGPYLQEVTRDGATVVFQTSDNSCSWVEVKPHGAADSEATRHYNSRDGLKEAWQKNWAVRMEGLKAGSRYDYRIVSKEMEEFQPYKVSYGDSLCTGWYSFTTIDPKKQGADIFITSDIHGDAAKLERLLDLADYRTCDAFFYAGDMMNYIDTPKAPYKACIDSSVRLFATSIPFEIVRGNHETRGNLARSYSGYFPKKEGKIYGSYLMGDVMIVMLDSGEDKAESHPVYAGLTDFDAYRTEQAEWLRRLTQTKEYKKARYRIVICHFPMVMQQEEKVRNLWHGWQDAIDKFLPVLNEAKVDLLVSGHTHRFFLHESGADGNRFPVLEQGYDSCTRLELHDGKVHVKVIDTKGQSLLDKTY